MTTFPLADRPRISRQTHLDDDPLRPGLRAALSGLPSKPTEEAPVAALPPLFETGRNTLFQIHRTVAGLGDAVPSELRAHLQALEMALVKLDAGSNGRRMNLLDFKIKRAKRQLEHPHVAARRDSVSDAMEALDKVRDQTSLVEDAGVRHKLEKQLDTIRHAVRGRFGIVGSD
ncbi:MAG: hypothetical protein RIT81_12935 [Deltaproteobacteria bacterium]